MRSMLSLSGVDLYSARPAVSHLECGGLTPLWIVAKPLYFGIRRISKRKIAPSQTKAASSRRTPNVLFMTAWGIALGIFAVLGGCGTEQSSSLPAAPIQWDEAGHDHAVHAHPTEGPHHGQLIELGNGAYHAELVHDESSHLVGVYLLDANATAAVPVTESELTINLLVDGKPTQFQLTASPLDGEPAQHSSHFELKDEKLCEALEKPNSKPRFNVSIHGRVFVAKIAKHDHEHAHTTHKH